MSKEYSPRVTQREIKPLEAKPMPIQLALETIRIDPKASVGKGSRKKISPEVQSYNQGLSASDIAREQKISEAAVYRRLEKTGTKRRKKKYALRLVWMNQEKRKRILSKSQSPEALKKRSEAVKRFRRNALFQRARKIGIFSKLTPGQREVLGYLYPKEKNSSPLTPEAIGEIIGIYPRSVIEREKRALKKVRKILKLLKHETRKSILRKEKKKGRVRINKENRRLVLKAMRDRDIFLMLTLKQREVLVYRYSAEENSTPLTYEEIAKKIRVRNRKVVWGREQRALREIKKLLQAKQSESKPLVDK